MRYFLRSQDFRILVNNFFNHSSIQATNYIIPLVTVPYLVRIMGPEKFGIITLAQMIVATIMIIIDYGFLITGVSKVAKIQKEKLKVNALYSVVLTIRMGLMVICAVILFMLSFIIKDLNEYAFIYIFSFAIIPGNILLASWFYIGFEKAKYLNAINLFSKILYISSIFYFIREAQDYYLVPALNSSSVILAGIISLTIAKVYFNINYALPKVQEIIISLKNGWNIFFANFSMNLYRNLNIVILGIFASKELIGIYGAGEKIIKAFQNLFIPITNSFFPYISRLKEKSNQKSIKAIKGLLILLGTMTFSVSLLLFVYAPEITTLILGDGFSGTIMVVKISSFVIFLSFFNYVLGIIYMVNFDLEAQFRKAVMLTGVLNIIICTIASYNFLEIGAAFSLILAELILFCFILYFTIQSKTFKI